MSPTESTLAKSWCFYKQWTREVLAQVLLVFLIVSITAEVTEKVFMPIVRTSCQSGIQEINVFGR